MSDDRKVSVEDIPKFIERLIDTEDATEYESLCFQKETERLNNIINEMEKFLKINIEKDDYDLTEYNKGVNNAYNHTLDKLKELKENKYV